jgi:outer membrane protein assembly factor BamB
MTLGKPLRLWPGVALATLVVLFKFVLPAIGLGTPLVGLLGGPVAALLIVLWWLLFSRAPWSERLAAVALMVGGLWVTSFFLHPSIAGGTGGMSVLLPILATPMVCLALVAWAVVTHRYSDGVRRATLAATLLIACGAWTQVRTDGITGDGHIDLHWRWTKTPEERLLAQAGQPATPSSQPLPTSPAPAASTEKSPAPSEPAAKATEPAPEISGRAPVAGASAPLATATPREPTTASARAEWPGFRGPGRDSAIPGLRIATDWTASPPVELWRRPVGPGWSSFAVQGDRLYTQEQRGESEIVACYDARTGEPVWQHRNGTRFWEPAAGAGPRGTPTLSQGRVYALGATGILNTLDAKTGAVLWSHDAAVEEGVENPGWGFAGSPLVVNDLVVVALAGRLAAYDGATGRRRWLGPEGGSGYSSPQLVTIAGVPQILLLRGSRTTSVSPADGTLLWEHKWQPGISFLQPAVTESGDVLVAEGEAMSGQGIQRLAVQHGAAGWTVEERWTSRDLKPYFNDFVVHKGHAYGFDGSIMACIDLADGTRRWKGGRYGHGQLVLLPDQDLLLVLSEEGEVALVNATPDRFTEIARFKAIEGKTWNHPAVVGTLLLVRNGEEMAAFRLKSAAAPGTQE